MAQIAITIPDAVLPRVLDAFAARGFDPAGGLTKAQYAKQQVIAHIRNVVRAYETEQAVRAAAAQASTTADADIALS